VAPPFHCDHGHGIKLGENVFINYNGTMLDGGIITIVGGGVTVCPGVTIGDHGIIGAGSVVVKDIPSDSIAVGNPCRVIRKVNTNQ